MTRSLAVLAALLAVLAVALVAAGCGSTGSSSTTSTTSNASTGRLGAAVTECPGFSTDRDEVAILRGLGVSCEVAHKIALAQLTRGERLPEDWSCTRHLMDGNTKNDESVACHNRYEDEAVQFTVRWL